MQNNVSVEFGLAFERHSLQVRPECRPERARHTGCGLQGEREGGQSHGGVSWNVGIAESAAAEGGRGLLVQPPCMCLAA